MKIFMLFCLNKNTIIYKHLFNSLNPHKKRANLKRSCNKRYFTILNFLTNFLFEVQVWNFLHKYSSLLQTLNTTNQKLIISHNFKSQWYHIPSIEFVDLALTTHVYTYLKWYLFIKSGKYNNFDFTRSLSFEEWIHRMSKTKVLNNLINRLYVLIIVVFSRKK